MNEADLDLLHVGGQKGHGGQGGGTDGETLPGGRGGVPQSVQGVRSLPNLRLLVGHLGVAAGVIGDGTVGVCGQGDPQG